MARKPTKKTCEACGVEFWTGAAAQRFCGHSCASRTTRPVFVPGNCSVVGCEYRGRLKGGMCPVHYKRVYRNGSTTAIRNRKPATMSGDEWFFSQVQKTETCWIWTGATMDKRGGYGYLYSPDLKQKIRAHHYLVGKPPAGRPKMEWDHLCRNVRCVRPEHLELVTAAENRRRQWDSDEVCAERVAKAMAELRPPNPIAPPPDPW